MSINNFILRRILSHSRPSSIAYYGLVNNIHDPIRTYSSISSSTPKLSTLPFQSMNNFVVYPIQKRFRKVKKSNNSDEKDNDESSDDEDDSNENPLLTEEDTSVSDGSETIVLDIGSLRLDAFAKVAFGSTRAKIEEAFYRGDLYVNGERPSRKSCDLSINDEIDLVRQVNEEDRSKLDIRRVQIIKLPDKTTEQGRIKVTVKRWAELTVDVYDK